MSDDFARLLADLAADLPDGDGAHDRAHLRRVWANARRIMREEGGDPSILAAATALHDCVHVEKSSPLRNQASRLAAAQARKILAARGWTEPALSAVAHAIEAHSFTAGITPTTLEARILQDADRLDAIGHVGIARCFYTGGRMGSALYHPDDPAGATRELDDRAYALDHFRVKLLKLADGFQTPAGARLAAARTEATAAFMAAMEAEIAGDEPAC